VIKIFSAGDRAANSRFTGFVAALEVLGYLSSIAIATLAFLIGWLTLDEAAVLSLLLLIFLAVLAWTRFDGGRHPCFLFLCLLTLFQAGRLIAFCAGSVTHIFRVQLMTAYPFDVSRQVSGTVLLSLVLSALCVYAPCRWQYRPMGPVTSTALNRFLPYLYLLLWMSLPVQLFKNFRYYEYARNHGGYLVFFIDHGGLAASIPTAVRAISLVSVPALIGIFVLERRRKFLYITAGVYLLTTAPLLLTGSRGAVFCLILSLWYLAKRRSGKRPRLYALGLVAAGLVLVAALIGGLRTGNAGKTLAGPIAFVADQGMSLHVTVVAVAEQGHFAPHLASYLLSELQAAFVAPDQANYVAGNRFGDDVAMFLNPIAYRLGFGSGSSYLAEAYVIGRLGGVVVISILVGLLLHGMHVASRTPLGLFVVVMVLPDVLWMTRAGLLDWVSSSLRGAISLLLLLAGWCVYRSFTRIAGALRPDDAALDVRSHGLLPHA
jgi:hypothetical protein